MHRLDLGLYSHPKNCEGNRVRTQVKSKGKIPSTGKISPEADRTHDAVSSRTAIPTHYQLSYSGSPGGRGVCQLDILLDTDCVSYFSQSKISPGIIRKYHQTIAFVPFKKIVFRSLLQSVCLTWEEGCVYLLSHKRFALRTEVPVFDSRLRHGDFSGSSHTSDLNIGTPAASLPGT